MLDMSQAKSVKVLWFLVAIVWLGVFPLDVILPSFPAIGKTLAVSISKIAMSLSLFSVCVAISQLIIGPVSDVVGRKKLLVGGLAISVIGAVGSALSNNLVGFIIFRTIQALGCGCFVLAHALVQDLFATQDSARVRIFLTTMGGIFIATSPLLGSWLQDLFNWQSSFYLFCIIALYIIYQVFALLPADPKSRKNINFFKVYKVVCSDTQFLSNAVISSLCFACHFSFIVVSPVLLIGKIGLSAYDFSLVLLVYGFAYIVGGFIANFLHFRITSLRQIQCGLSLIGFSGVSLWLGVEALGSSVGSILLPMIFCTAGATITRPIAFSLAMARFPSNAGAAAAVANTLLFFVGGVISGLIAISGDDLVRNLSCGFILASVLAIACSHCR